MQKTKNQHFSASCQVLRFIFMKQNLRCGLVWAGWAMESPGVSCTFYNYFEQHPVHINKRENML